MKDKQFDISEHKFSDCDIESVEIDGYANDEYLHFDFKQETNELTHSKDDVIAMAKALKLTADDLKPTPRSHRKLVQFKDY